MDARSTNDPVEPVSPGLRIAPTPAARSVGPGGGQSLAPAARSGVMGRIQALKRNPWFSVATRSAAVFLGMLGLAAIGATSTLAGAGVPVQVPKPSAGPAASGEWIAPDGSASKPGSAPFPSAIGSTALPAGSTGNGSSLVPGASPENAGAGTPASAGLTSDGKVILNTASADELMKLPRVGAKRAQAILELRHRLGHFQRATDLLRVRGIGHKMLKQILPLIVVDAPAKP